MNIAIIGAGISGLVAAYKLNPRHRITVFEASNHIGGHTNTIPVKWRGESHCIDTGFIVFNRHNYPRFSALLETLGVESQDTSMSFSVRNDRTGLEYNGASLNTLFAQRRNLLRPQFLHMIREILRFHREAPDALADNDAETVSQWTESRGFAKSFVEDYLAPLGACLWSCPAGTFREFPIRFVVEFMSNHMMLQASGRPIWRVVKGGSFRYVEKLMAGFRDRIRTGCPVRAVRRDDGGVNVVTPQGSERFDHAVIACHADNALAMLADASAAERQLLGAFPYQRNEVTLHTDASVMPRKRRAWAAWNARIHADGSRFSCTYNMNILQELNSSHTFCVTLNDPRGVDPDRVLGQYSYDHPVFTRRRLESQRRHTELLNHRHTSYCGAYWGFGFHEDGVKSAMAACAAIESSVTARAPMQGAIS